MPEGFVYWGVDQANMLAMGRDMPTLLCIRTGHHESNSSSVTWVLGIFSITGHDIDSGSLMYFMRIVWLIDWLRLSDSSVLFHPHGLHRHGLGCFPSVKKDDNADEN